MGVDCATKHDCAAVVAVMRDRDRVALARHRIWKPTPQTPLDIESTVEAELRDLCRNHDVREISVDPFQMARSIPTLGREGLRSGSFRNRRDCTGWADHSSNSSEPAPRRYTAADLGARANTVVVESARGWRIAKDKRRRSSTASWLEMASSPSASGRRAHAVVFSHDHPGGRRMPTGGKNRRPPERAHCHNPSDRCGILRPEGLDRQPGPPIRPEATTPLTDLCGPVVRWERRIAGATAGLRVELILKVLRRCEV